MKAAVMTRYGPPEVVHVMDVPPPAPAVDELLVQVHTTTVNRTDCGFRAGHPWFIRGFAGVTKPKRPILGNEFAGVVQAVDENVVITVAGDSDRQR
jgi:NADPH:quinone reductase-like Zn-dependent oxidoreductase